MNDLGLRITIGKYKSYQFIGDETSNVIMEGLAGLVNTHGFYTGLLPAIKANHRMYRFSWLNFAREAGRLGWSDRTIISMLKEINSIFPTVDTEIELVKRFLSVDYHAQCKMLFEWHYEGDYEKGWQSLGDSDTTYAETVQALGRNKG